MERQEFTTYLPQIRKRIQVARRPREVLRPLFPGYIFVRLCPTSLERLKVLQAAGAVRFVSFGTTIAQIPDKQIADIQLILERKVPCTPHDFLSAGQRVRIRGGCLEGVEGVLVTVNSDSSMIVSIGAIQGSVAIRIHGYDFEAA